MESPTEIQISKETNCYGAPTLGMDNGKPGLPLDRLHIFQGKTREVGMVFLELGM